MIRYRKGHKNSKGETAEWVIISHENNKIISSHKTKEEAKKHLNDIRMFKHINKSMDINEAKQILKEHGYKVQSLNKLKREIYNAVEPYTKNMVRLDNFSKIIDIQEAIRNVVVPDLMCDIDGGNSIRRNKDGLEYREFDISIYENKGDYEMVLEGKLVCNSAGTMDEPWKLYDITILL